MSMQKTKADASGKIGCIIFIDGKLAGLSASMTSAISIISQSHTGHIFDADKNIIVFFKKAEK